MMTFLAAAILTSTITWGNSVDRTDVIQVEKAAKASGPFTVLVQLAPNSTTYVDSQNQAGTTSCYRVAYVTTTGLGPYAGPVCKTFPKAHGKPHR